MNNLKPDFIKVMIVIIHVILLAAAVPISISVMDGATKDTQAIVTVVTYLSMAVITCSLIHAVIPLKKS